MFKIFKKMKIKIGELYDIYQKYGDFGFKVNTPYGYKNIEWCGITEKNADVYRCELDNGMFVEGADYHKLKKNNDEFVVLKEIQIGETIQTISGDSSVVSVRLLEEKDTLYDVQVAEVHQYYTNGIVSHNTVLSVDLLLFLFFNETTKTTKAEEIFNRFTDKNKVSVKGEVLIDGEEYIILRTLERKRAKSGEWNVKTELDFFKRLSDDSLQNFTGEQRRETEKFIKTSIGTKEDFLMTILTTGTNLEDLIDSKPTARGQVLSRFMGLEFLKRKEEIAKEIYSEFSKSMISNIYNSEKLKSDNQEKGETIVLLKKQIEDANTTLIDIQDRIIKGQEFRDDLLKQKHSDIDVEISNLSPTKVSSDIESLEFNKSGVVKQLSELKVVEPTEFYHEDKHDEVKNEYNVQYKELVRVQTEIASIEKLQSSVSGGIICEHCGIDLMNASITQAKINELAGYIVHKDEITGLMTVLSGKDESFVKLKKEFDEYEKNKLIKDKYELSIESYDLKINNLKEKLKKYNEVQDKIAANEKIDEKILKSGMRLDELNGCKKQTENTISTSNYKIETLTEEITGNNDKIKRIEVESEQEKIYKIYLEIYGKNGISKMIMRTMMPLINSELQRLLENSCHFRIEVRINDKNEVDFIMVDNNTQVEKNMVSGSGYERTIASLSLRAVLSKICSLPKPNIVVMDEIFGKISNDNLDMVYEFFTKIKEYFEKIFVITHNPLVTNWADNIIKVRKEENISFVSQ
jgi:DNA repair exonuclease SbcCD ATPase subunit